MKRGKFILVSGLGIVAIGIPALYYKLNKPDNEQIVCHPELLSRIWDTATLRHIGELYRQQFTVENNEAALRSKLSKNIAPEPSTTADLLQQQIKSDYTKGNTLMLDGWILSHTEARQCALYSLTQ